MIHTDKKILSLATALLLCFGTLALAAPPEGKGGGKGGTGNQPIDATADFNFAGEIIEIMSNVALQGEFIDNGDFDTLAGQLAMGETITVGGDAGEALETLAASVLPAQDQGVDIQPGMVTFDELGEVSWTIRLDRDKQPENRVQFKMRWLNGAGFEHHLRIGWVVQGGYEDEIYPLPDSEYGEVPEGVTSLESATVTFATDFFRIDGKVPTGRGKKTELEVFSHYGEINAPWCPNRTCRESTTIKTALAN